MNCTQVRALLGAHVDDELDVRSAVEVESHLRECADCRAELADLRTVRQAARAHLQRFAPSPRLQKRLAASIRPRRTPWVWLATTSVTFAAVAALFLLFFRPASDGLMVAEVIDAHTRSLLPGHEVDVVSSDQHTVKPWFNGKINFGVPVEDFAAQGFPLVGGRLDSIDGRDVAALVYKRRSHTINVFVWPDESNEKAEENRKRGYTVRHWSRAGLAWWMVTDASPNDLRELEGYLAKIDVPR